MGATLDDEHQITNQSTEDEEEQQQQPQAKDRPAGQSGEQSAPDATASEVKALYKDLGIEAPIPTGATKGRPKASDVRAKKSEEDGARSTDSERKTEKDADDKDKSKDAPSANSDDNSGNKADAKGSKNSSDDDGVQDESGKADKGVRGTESRDEEDSERRREEDTDGRASGDESTEHDESGEAEGESTDEEGVKRPGKSNPAVEQRFQKLTSDLKDKDAEIERLNSQLRDNAEQRAKVRISQEDPEYKLEDFRMVRDNATGEIKELSEEQAELAWRRWKDGYDQRGEERQAEINRQASLEQQENEIAQQIMTQSVQAYDTIASLMDEFPELVSTSGVYDKEFAIEALPIIQESMEYEDGTEPGNAEGNLPVVVGLRINPKKILNAMKKINTKKRSLPLNGVNDNVELRSNVGVSHSRSSDPTVNAANDLMKELKINKRF